MGEDQTRQYDNPDQPHYGIAGGGIDSINDAPPASGPGSTGTVGTGQAGSAHAGAVSDTDAEGSGSAGSFPPGYLANANQGEYGGEGGIARAAERDRQPGDRRIGANALGASGQRAGRDASAAGQQPDPDITPGYDVHDDPSRGFLPGKHGDLSDSPPGTD